MGNFYVNQTVATDDRDAVAAALRDYQAFISPVKNGCIVVCERASDDQNIGWAMAVSSHLSATLKCPVLNMLNHDDDALFYSLHVNGEPVDMYESSPAPDEAYGGDDDEAALPMGDAGKLCAAFPHGDPENVETILRGIQAGEYGILAFEQHRALVEALGLSDYAVGTGWHYIAKDDLTRGIGKADFLEVKGEAAYQGVSFPD